MDGAEAGAGAWATIRGYFTPATLFLVVNLVIGTIALTSRSHQRRRRQAHLYGQYYHHDGGPGHPEMMRHDDRLQLPQEYGDGGGLYYGHQQGTLYVPPPPAPAQLARTSSVLDRLRSFGLYRFRSGDFPPEFATAAAATSHAEEEVVSPAVDEVNQTQYARSRSEPAPAQEEKKAKSRLRNSSSEVRKAEVVRATARVVEAFPEEATIDGRADEFIDDSTPKQRDPPHQQEYVPPPAPAPAPLARTSSVLDRLRSFSLSFRSGDLAAAAAEATPAHDAAADDKNQSAHYARSRSEPKTKKQAASEAKMTKSSSEARKEPAAEEADDGVDARADDFINKFRQQLQLQRLNSLLNYKEMLRKQ
ncbi:pathogen-associated molecular patterns-induced protein A70-like [Oryza brachyantha]|uniref:pathogen-associated molecular patterns-induced protein A70-like n=1 Tax=Oryza brachyantha TaxID=4533 RepID=UPI001ADA59DE|nr:pathogen-associated molecular patterns-induced protein A70-like [Oryza brachyantha]